MLRQNVKIKNRHTSAHNRSPPPEQLTIGTSTIENRKLPIDNQTLYIRTLCGKENFMNKLRVTGIALTVLLAMTILFTACPNTAGGGNSGAGGEGGTVPPTGSPLDGVWRVVSGTDNDGTEVTFPITDSDGTETQPYFCFWNGKMCEAEKISNSPTPSNNGLYKDGEADPFTFDGTKIFIEEEHEFASVALSGNTMTLTFKEDSRFDSILLEKTASPTVQDILEAPITP
ncbi:hypothetical protein [Treponema pedis]|uniref:hypothetical protein n=1 Tax=Treponema pedis TaxID=409322 RepID=UPI001268B34C|nr:hypothetical protein [Treponema pedis]